MRTRKYKVRGCDPITGLVIGLGVATTLESAMALPGASDDRAKWIERWSRSLAPRTGWCWRCEVVARRLHGQWKTSIKEPAT